jgi:hypothetical protein
VYIRLFWNIQIGGFFYRQYICTIKIYVYLCASVKGFSMKEKFQFIYDSVSNAINQLNQKKITVEHAKALASLAKQANNVIATQLDAAKFMANVKDLAKQELENVGLSESEK